MFLIFPRIFYCVVTILLHVTYLLLNAGGDLVLIQKSLLLLCKSSCYNTNYVLLHNKSRKVCIKARPRCYLKARSSSRQL